MIRVPLQAVPNQTLTVSLGGQNVQLAIRQNGANLYFDLLSNLNPIVRARICRDRQRILIGSHYRGFIGDFAFVDLRGSDDPFYSGLGDRWQLYYLEASE